MKVSGFQFPGVKALLLAMFCIAFAIGFGVSTAGDISDLINAIALHKPMIEFFHYTSIIVISLPLMFSFGLFGLFSRPIYSVPQKSKGKDRREKKVSWGDRLGALYMLYLFISIPIALFSPIPQFLILNHLLSERGYVFCPAPLFARNPPDRWALPGPHGPKEHCPREAGAAS